MVFCKTCLRILPYSSDQKGSESGEIADGFLGDAGTKFSSFISIHRVTQQPAEASTITIWSRTNKSIIIVINSF